MQSSEITARQVPVGRVEEPREPRLPRLPGDVHAEHPHEGAREGAVLAPPALVRDHARRRAPARSAPIARPAATGTAARHGPPRPAAPPAPRPAAPAPTGQPAARPGSRPGRWRPCSARPPSSWRDEQRVQLEAVVVGHEPRRLLVGVGLERHHRLGRVGVVLLPPRHQRLLEPRPERLPPDQHQRVARSQRKIRSGSGVRSHWKSAGSRSQAASLDPRGRRGPRPPPASAPSTRGHRAALGQPQPAVAPDHLLEPRLAARAGRTAPSRPAPGSAAPSGTNGSAAPSASRRTARAPSAGSARRCPWW